ARAVLRLVVSMPQTLEAVTLQGRIVDLNPEAGCVGQVQEAVPQLTFAAGDGLREEALGGEAMCNPGIAAPRVVLVIALTGGHWIERLRCVSRGRDSHRTVECARHIRAQMHRDPPRE